MKNSRATIHGVIAAVLLLTPMAVAQITIQKTDFQKIFSANATLKFRSDTSTVVNVGKSGGPNVYDFSGLAFKDTLTQFVYVSSTVPFIATRFGSSALFWSNSYAHANGAPVVTFGTTTFESLSVVTITDTSQEVKYHVPHEIIGQFPMTYNQNWGTTGAGLGTDSLFVNNVLKSTNPGYNSAETTYVDGYGTLLLLGQSHQCLRVRQVEVASYTHKGFEYFTKDGIVLLIDSDKSQNDTGRVAVTGINIIAATTVTSVNEVVDVPGEFSLDQNFPNPFNPSTVIRYDVPRTAHVSLVVYDMLGRAVAVLVNEEKAPGRYNIEWNAGSFASGVYFCRLSSPGVVQTRKLLLMK